MATKIENMLQLAQCEPVALADKQVWDWQQRWRSVYAAELHALTGKWIENDLDWHVFCRGHYAHKQGDRAWAEYRRIEAGPFLVISSDTHRTFGFACNGKPPEGLDCGIDLSVVPPSLEWTMAFNHEGYGPYFAVAP